MKPRLFIVCALACATLPAHGVDVTAMFDRYCYECHGEGQRKGKFSLEELLAKGADETARGAWAKTWKIVRHGFMPPAEADALPEAERQTLVRWMEDQRLGVDRTRPDPGRVTVSRLNRMEYEFTITDLFGTDVTTEGEFSSDVSSSKTRLREMLPPDDTAFGFDNIGDFQTLSPALLEKYFDLAELVVGRVVALDGPRLPERTLEGVRAIRTEEKKRVEHTLDFAVEHAGRYRVQFQFHLGGWQEYGGAFDFAVSVDGTELTRTVVEDGGQKLYRPAGEVALTPGTHRLVFSTEAVKADFKGNFRHLELRPKITLTGPLDERFAEYPESHRRIFFQGPPPADAEARREYARQIMERIAERAFRRPVEAATREKLADLVMEAPQFERGVADGLLAILSSPKFLFRAEAQPQPDDPKAIHPIDEYALASRLSYFLWLSLPDEELRALAARGELRKNLPAQLHRMLADPKSARFFEDFPGQWLRTRNVLMTPVSRRDEVVNEVRGAMKRETEMLFEHIAREDRDLLELVTADYTFVDRPLARFYGLPEVAGGFQKVSLPADSKRGGILTHGTFLFSTSNPGRTSPVKRGLFVLENLLAIEPPPPPPSVPSLDEAKAGGATPKTVREQLALHREDKACAGCHAHFDPIGLALENYDAIGRWRAAEAGEPIAPNEKTVTGQTLTGAADLKAMFIARKSQFYHCVTEKLLTYALGRGLEPGDAPVVDAIAARVGAEGGKFSTLLAAIVDSAPFQMRRGDDGALKIAPRVTVPEPPPPDQRKGRQFRRLIFPNEPPPKPKP
jgi:hypothetical protein